MLEFNNLIQFPESIKELLLLLSGGDVTIPELRAKDYPFFDATYGHGEHGLKKFCCDLVLVAMSYGCPQYCMSILSSALQENGLIPTKDALFLCKAAYPYQATADRTFEKDMDFINRLVDRGNSKTNYDDDDFFEICSSLEQTMSGAPLTFAERFTPESMSSAIELTTGISQCVFNTVSGWCTLPALSLFVARSVTVDPLGKNNIPSLFSGPGGNHRLLSLYRLSSTYKDGDETHKPLIDVLSNEATLPSLTKVGVSVLPYCVNMESDDKETNNRDNNISQSVLPLFAESAGNAPLEDSLSFANAADEIALKGLIQVLSPSKKGDSEYIFEYDEAGLESAGQGADVRVSYLLNHIFMILFHRFDGLCNVHSWMRLFWVLRNHLFHEADAEIDLERELTITGSFFLPVNFGELVHHTIMMFHLITPVRLSFVDGQSRVCAVLHCLLGIHPFVSVMEPSSSVPVQFYGVRKRRKVVYGTPNETFWSAMNVKCPIEIMSANWDHAEGTEPAQASRLSSIILFCAWHHSSLSQSSVEAATRKSLHDAAMNALDPRLTMIPHIPSMGRDDCVAALVAKRRLVMGLLMNFSCAVVDHWIIIMRERARKTRSLDFHGIDDLESTYQNTLTNSLPAIEAILPFRQPPSDFFALTVFLVASTTDWKSLQTLRNCITDNFVGRLNRPHLLNHLIENNFEAEVGDILKKGFANGTANSKIGMVNTVVVSGYCLFHPWTHHMLSKS